MIVVRVPTNVKNDDVTVGGDHLAVPLAVGSDDVIGTHGMMDQQNNLKEI